MSSGGVRNRLKLKLRGHKFEEMVPTVEKEVTGQGAQVIEEGTSRAEFLANALVVGGGEGEDGMAEKG